MVGFKIYKNCFRAGAHWLIIVFLILINVAAQVNSNIYFGLCFQLDTYVLIHNMFILLFLICILRDMFPRLGSWGCVILLRCTWNQKSRPAAWNLRQDLTLLSWGRISSSSRNRKDWVLLLRPSSDWMRPPQCLGWSPLLKFWWWMWTTSTTYFTTTSRWVFGWITGDWPHQADTENWSLLYLLSFFPWKNPNICTVAFCSPLGFALYTLYVESKVF